MKSDERTDKAGPNMILYEEIISHHQGEETTEIETKLSPMFPHQELFCGGAWTTKAKKKKMREDYSVFREQSVKMEGSTLKVRIDTTDSCDQ